MQVLKKTVKVLYGESHSNIDIKNNVPEGGLLRFAQIFREYFLGRSTIELSPVLFTHALKKGEPFIRNTTIKGHVFKEIVYDRELIRSMYSLSWTRTSFLKHVSPLIKQAELLFDEVKPDIVFINGIILTNWVLLYVARKKKIPVVIQHAGIWKKEIRSGANGLSSSLRKMFYQVERDTITLGCHHIFLNEYSKNVFLNLYRINEKQLLSFRIIPLPIPLPDSVTDSRKPHAGTSVKIGVVARWDSIKNHSAVLRLATAMSALKNWSVHTVASMPQKLSDFGQRYVKQVIIHKPMSPQQLTHFYRSMDVVFLPSHFDVSPGVVPEALLAGTPVIISERVGWVDEFRACGLDDHIISGKASGKTLLAAVKNIVQKSKENQIKYTELVHHIRKQHDPKKVLKQYEDLFTAAVN